MIFRTIESDVGGLNNQLGILGKSFSDVRRDFKNGLGFRTSVFSNKITESDIAAITKYTDEIKNGVPTGQAWRNTMTGCTVSAKKHVGACKNDINSLEKLKSSQNATKASTIGLSIAQTALNAALYAGIALLVQLVYKGLDYLIHYTEKQREQLSKLKSEYEDLTSKLDDVNDKIETNKSRILELKKLKNDGGLSFVQQQELENLQKQNDEYERQRLLLEQMKNLKNQEKNRQFVKTMNSDLNTRDEYTHALNGKTAKTLSWENAFYTVGSMGINRGYLSEQGYITQQFQRLQILKEQQAKASTETEKNRIQKQIDEIQKYLSDKQAEFAEDSEGIEYIKNPTNDDDKKVNNWLDFINDFTDKLAIATTEGTEKANLQGVAFKRIFNKSEFDELRNELSSLSKTGELTAESLNSSKYDDFIQNLIDCGVISDKSSESIQKIIDAINNLGDATERNGEKALNSFDDLQTKTSELESAYNRISKAQKDYKLITDAVNGSHYLTSEQIAQLCDTYDGLDKKVKLTEKGWTFEASALDIVQEAMLNLQSTYLSAQNAMTTALNSEAKVRLELLYGELSSIKTVADAYDAIKKQRQSNPLYNFSVELGFTGKKISLIDNMDILNEDEQKLVAYAKAQETLQESLNKLDELRKSGIGVQKDKSKSSKKINTVKNAVDALSLSVERLDMLINGLDTALDLTSEENYEARLELLTDKFALTQEKAQALREEFDELCAIQPRTADEAETLASQLSSVGNSLRENYKAAAELAVELEKARINNLVSINEKTMERLNYYTDRLRNNVDRYKNGNLGLMGFNNFMLPSIPKSAYEKQKSENEKLIENHQATVNKITEIKRLAIKLQKEENDKAIAETNDKISSALSNTEESVQQTSDNVSKTQKKTDEETTNQLRNDLSDKKKEVTTFVDDIKSFIKDLSDWLKKYKIEAPSLSESWQKLKEDMQNTFVNNGTGNGDGKQNVSNNNGASASSSKVPYFNQGDYAAYTYGSGSMKDTACGPTSMAMVLSALGKNVDPIEAAKYSEEHGHYVWGEGTSHAFFPDIANAYGINCDKIGTSSNDIKSALSAGQIVITSMKPGHFTSNGHFIVLSGINSDGKVIVKDPFSRKRTNELWDLNTIVAESKAGWAFYATGTPNGNIKASRLGIAGENYKPEILIDKDSGEKTYIDKPTVIDISKTDVIGEKQTAKMPKFASGNVRPGVGVPKTWMDYDQNWTSGTLQRKFHNAIANDKWIDELGFERLGERYVVAVKEFFGQVGDFIDIMQADGTIIKGVIGDNKGMEKDGDTQVHYDGSVVEFLMDENIVGGKQPNDLHPEWKQTVYSIDKVGNYFEDGMEAITNEIKQNTNAATEEQQKIDEYLKENKTRDDKEIESRYDTQRTEYNKNALDIGERFTSLLNFIERAKNAGFGIRDAYRAVSKMAIQERDVRVIKESAINAAEQIDSYYSALEDVKILYELRNQRINEGATPDQLSAINDKIREAQEHVEEISQNFVDSIKTVTDYFAAKVERSANDFNNSISNKERDIGFIDDSMDIAKTNAEQYDLLDRKSRIIQEEIDASAAQMEEQQSIMRDMIQKWVGEDYGVQQALNNIDLGQFIDVQGNVIQKKLDDFLAPYEMSDDPEMLRIASVIRSILSDGGYIDANKAYAEAYDSLWSSKIKLIENERAKMQLYYDDAQKVRDLESKRIEQENKQLERQTKLQQGLLDIIQNKYSLINNLTKAQREADKAIASSRISKQYLTNDEYKLIYNEEDYESESDKIKQIRNEVEDLTNQFNSDINDAYRKDKTYLIESITAEYERQIGMKERELEITQEELELVKKRQSLENTIAEKNIRQIVERNGKLQWEWVADTDKVRSAMEDLADASANVEQKTNEYLQQQDLNNRESSISNINNVINANNDYIDKLDDDLNEMSLAIERLTTPVIDLESTIKSVKDEGFAPLLESLNTFKNKIDEMSIENSGKTPDSGSGWVRRALAQETITPEVTTSKSAKNTETTTTITIAPSQTGKTINVGNKLVDIPKINGNAQFTIDVKKKYGTGTKRADSGIIEVDDNGEETYITPYGTLHNFAGGEMVFSAEQTKALWNMSKGIYHTSSLPIPNVETPNVKIGENKVNNLNGDIIIQNPANFNEFVKKLTQAIRQKGV